MNLLKFTSDLGACALGKGGRGESGRENEGEGVFGLIVSELGRNFCTQFLRMYS